MLLCALCSKGDTSSLLLLFEMCMHLNRNVIQRLLHLGKRKFGVIPCVYVNRNLLITNISAPHDILEL